MAVEDYMIRPEDITQFIEPIRLFLEPFTDVLMAHPLGVSVVTSMLAFLVISKHFNVIGGVYSSVLVLVGFCIMGWTPIWIPIIMGMLVAAVTVWTVMK